MRKNTRDVVVKNLNQNHCFSIKSFTLFCLQGNQQESDSIVSFNNMPGLNSLIERKSGLILLTKISEKTVDAKTEAIIRRLLGLPRYTLTIGLVRWYFPKKTDFRGVNDEEIARVEYALNTRPRKRLGWKTPLEVFSEELKHINNRININNNMLSQLILAENKPKRWRFNLQGKNPSPLFY